MQSASKLNQHQSNCVTNHAHHIVKLPAPPETFTANDLPEDSNLRQQLKYWAQNGLVHQIERRPTGYLWMVDRRAYDRAETVAKDRDTLPCGHTGFTNLGDGDYGCQVCDAVYDRETVEEVLD